MSINLHADAQRFKELSIKYRHNPSQELMNSIKQLVNENAERIARTFTLSLDIKQSKFRRGRGIPMVGLSMSKIIQKGDSFTPKDMMSLDTRSNKRLNGVNILLDYSGSMWFNGSLDTLSGIQRIFCQNFFALCLGVYIQRLSNSTMKILYTTLANDAIFLLETENMQTADWDGLLVDKECYERYGGIKPFVLAMTTDRFHDTIYPRVSFTRSYARFKELSMANFITIVVTDGGMHRVGETHEDRTVFMRKLISTVASDNQLVFWQFIAMQGSDGREVMELVKEHSMPYSIVNSRDEYNNCFAYLSHLVNETVRRR